MKIYIIKSLATLSLFSGFVLTGCLKDKDYDERTIQSNHGDSPKVIEIGLTGTSYRNFAAKSLEASANDTTIVLFPVQLASNEPAQEDINVTITKSDAAVTAYNATQASTTGFVPYVAAPSANTTIVNANGIVTIPKGSYSGLLSIRIKSNNFIGANYAIGFTISSVDKPGYVISGNLQNAVVGIAVKNKYDGVYKLNLRLDGWDAYGISSGIAGDYNANFELVTSGANSVTTNALAPSGIKDAQPGFTGGVNSITGYTSFGATAPKYSFDATDKVSSVINTVPDDGRGRAFYLDPASTTSRWTSSPRGVKVEYYMKQNGRPDQKITAIYTYIKAR